MTHRLIVYPDEGGVGASEKVVFLLGPTSGVRNWQEEAAELIWRADDSILVVTPKKPVWLTRSSEAEKTAGETFGNGKNDMRGKF